MPRTRRRILATASETVSPPENLLETQTIARVVQAAGNHLYSVELPLSFVAKHSISKGSALIEMPERFRNSIWVKKGSYVVADLKACLAEGGRDLKISGEIVNIVREEKRWRTMQYWPAEFMKSTLAYSSSDSEEESIVGKMPPSDPSDDES